MGIAGHAIMWNTIRSSSFFGRMTVEVIDILNLICWFASLSISIFIAMCYVYKMCTSYPLVLSEYLDEVRCHFFNAPNLIFIMLLISLPDYMKVSKQSELIWYIIYIYIVLRFEISESLHPFHSWSKSFASPRVLAVRILWAPAFLYQVVMTSNIYMAWMFSKRRNFTGEIGYGCTSINIHHHASYAALTIEDYRRLFWYPAEAKPQFLLSTVGWFLLAVL